MDGKAEAYGTVWSVVVCVVGVVELVVRMGVSMVVSAWGSHSGSGWSRSGLDSGDLAGCWGSLFWPSFCSGICVGCF